MSRAAGVFAPVVGSEWGIGLTRRAPRILPFLGNSARHRGIIPHGSVPTERRRATGAPASNLADLTPH